MNEKTKNLFTVCLLGALLLSIALFCWLKPQDDFSDSERRVLAQFPQIKWEKVLSAKWMSEFETYALDQFPLRDDFRALKSAASLYVLNQKDTHDIFMADGHISKLEYPMKEDMLTYSADLFNSIYDKYLKDSGSNIYFSIVPDKNAYLAKENGYLSMDYKKAIEFMKERTRFMEFIDISDMLSADDFYYTDTHWRQEKITHIASFIAGNMGVELKDEYTQNVLDIPFYGVYCGQLALPQKPDTIIYLTNDTIDDLIVTSYSTGKPVPQSLYNMEKAGGKDAYEMFLSGAEAIVTIENPNASTDKELILFRDSFGGSIAPLFGEGYKKITVVDVRYVRSQVLDQFIEFNGQDVLFLYSTVLLNNSLAMK